MGWGSVKSDGSLPDDDLPHVDNPPGDFADQDFWRWVREHTDWDLLDSASNPLANSFALAGGALWQGRGLPPFVEAARPGGSAGTLRFAVRATRPARAMGTTDGRGPRGGAGRLALETGLGKGGLAAVSAAAVYYRRPVGGAGDAAERPSLFMPYWQAGLSPVASSERALAWRRQEGAP